MSRQFKIINGIFYWFVLSISFPLTYQVYAAVPFNKEIRQVGRISQTIDIQGVSQHHLMNEHRIQAQNTITDEDWEIVNSALNGANGDIEAIATHGSTVYVGGSFKVIGKVKANYIAKWDGNEWSALGTGVNNAVYAIAIDKEGNVYAGGYFWTAGEKTANAIAKWDGNEWSALGTGVNGSVRSLVLDSTGNIYVGGSFNITMAGGGSIKANIAKWDGTSWNKMKSSINGYVYALAVDHNGNVYAGGSFDTVGVAKIKNIAKWNGTEWSALGSGLNSSVYAFAVDSENNLFVGGQFDSAGTTEVNHIAKWNGSSWSSLLAGTGGSVYALQFDNTGKLYVGGYFWYIGELEANYIAMWNGSSWNTLGDGTANSISVMALTGSGHLLVTDKITYYGPPCLVEWDGSTWKGLGSELNGPISSVVIDSTRGILYVAGAFTTIGGIAVQSIAKWDGTSWSSLGSGVIGTIYTLILDSLGNLYAGGNFIITDGIFVQNIAKWDGTSWSSLGTGIIGKVNTLACDRSGNLYAGGSFWSAGGVSVQNIARWNGSSWSSVGSGIKGSVNAIVIDSSSKVYVGGSFDTAGGVFAKKIAQWDGSTWSPVGSGVKGYGYVSALAIDRLGNLYAGGYFDTIGGILAKKIAKWNGSVWSSVGSGLGWGTVYAIAVDSSNKVYVGGSFWSLGSENIVQWDGSEWRGLGSGVNGEVSHCAIDQARGYMYVTGVFGIAGKKVSPYLAKVCIISRQLQTISFSLTDSITKTYGDSGFTLRGSASSGLPVTFLSTDKNVASIKDSCVVIHKPGITYLSAVQAGNSQYKAVSSLSYKLKVTRKVLTISTTTAADKTYDGTTVAQLSSGSLIGLVPGDEVTLIAGSGSFADKNVGIQKSITVSKLVLSGAQAGNYSVAKPTGLSASIYPALLTIRANNVEKRVQNPDPSLTVSYTGFVSGEGAEVVNGLVITRDPGSTVGTYTIRPSKAVAPNYQITFVDGVFTILPEVAINQDNPIQNDKTIFSLKPKQNPTLLSSGKMELMVTSKNVSKIRIKIFDYHGTVVFEQEVPSAQLANSKPIVWNFSNTYGKRVNKGSYLLFAEVYEQQGSKVKIYKTTLGLKE